MVFINPGTTMQTLNPTLWRTCKMLAGATRIRLLRQLHVNADQCVTALGRSVGIHQPAASQELRRIQSRGLLQVVRQGPAVMYRLMADPQVPTAAPLLKAIQAALAGLPPEKDGLMCAIATGLAHERRIQIARVLMNGAHAPPELQQLLHIPPRPFWLHLQKLIAAGFVVPAQDRFQWTVPDHPLGRALAKLLGQGVTR